MEAGHARRLVLASSSPRRRALLAAAGFVFDVDAPDTDEAALPGETPEAMAVRLAGEKAATVAERWGGRSVVLGCDTLVVRDGAVLGKPSSEPHAVAMLLSLAGRSHEVITGHAVLADGAVSSGATRSLVHLRDVTPDEAEAYAATGEPLDKAGAYALQGAGGRFVTGVDGSRSNVVGLPLGVVAPLLIDLGVSRAPA
jgi:septum formation protein